MHPAPDLDPIPFGPVPTAPRRDGWTPARQGTFIDALGKCWLVSAAAWEVGMTPEFADRVRRNRVKFVKFGRRSLTSARHGAPRETTPIV